MESSSPLNGAQTEALRTLLSRLRPWLDDPAVTELVIDRPEVIFAKGAADWQAQRVASLEAGYLNALASAIIAANGLGSSPLTAAVLPGGERVQIVRPPVLPDGRISLAIRKHQTTVKSLETLAAEGAFTQCRDVSHHQPDRQTLEQSPGATPDVRLSDDDLELLRLKQAQDWPAFLLRCIALRRNVILAGKTGSGKTTFARSLIERVPRQERIITIEDVRELFLDSHPNQVNLLYGQSAGRIDATRCIATCLRLSPDRLFLAELRGDEAWEYLTALNTGHPGSITTTHANSAIDTFDRVSLLVKQSPVGRTLDLQAVRHLLLKTLDVVLYLDRRQVREVYFDPIHAQSLDATR